GSIIKSFIKKGFVKLLLDKGADPNIPDNNGKTPLHIAIEYRGKNKHPEGDFVQLLLDKGADPNIKGNLGETPMHLAVDYEDIDFFKSLLNKDDIEINAKDLIETTPLNRAIYKENIDLVKAIMKIPGVDCTLNSGVLGTDRRNLSLFEFALEEDRRKSVDYSSDKSITAALLRGNNAIIDIPQKHLVNEDGSTTRLYDFIKEAVKEKGNIASNIQSSIKRAENKPLDSGVEQSDKDEMQGRLDILAELFPDALKKEKSSELEEEAAASGERAAASEEKAAASGERPGFRERFNTSLRKMKRS
ncbi:ankyrin repeat domain-containing protein, partial [Rickettsiales bacterium]|nr:ankyrin repeat domain-containing protein [Rickettsiales bacterium]